jgi:hypothetical protein
LEKAHNDDEDCDYEKDATQQADGEKKHDGTHDVALFVACRECSKRQKGDSNCRNKKGGAAPH